MSQVRILVLAFTVLSTGILAYCAYRGLTPEQWASWIQAIGSIGAILASAAVVMYQRQCEIETAAEEERTHIRRKLNALRAMLMDIADNSKTIALKVHNRNVAWELERRHLDESRQRISMIPVFEIPDAGLVARLAAIESSLRAASIVADAMKSDRPKEVRDKVAEIISVPHDLCLEAIVEVTRLLKSRCSEAELHEDFSTFDRFHENSRLARETMERVSGKT